MAIGLSFEATASYARIRCISQIQLVSYYAATMPPSTPTQSQKSKFLIWKTFILTLSLILGFLDIWALSYWHRALIPDQAGDLKVVIGAMDAQGRSAVVSLDADSPLATQGIRAGDTIRFDFPGDRTRALGTDESIGMSATHAGRSWHIAVRPAPLSTIPPIKQWAYFLSVNCTVLALALGLLIGLRQPESAASRLLATALIVTNVDFYTALLPGGEVQTFHARVLQPIAIFLIYYLFVRFACLFPYDSMRHQHRAVRFLLVPYMALYGVFTLFRIGAGFGIMLLPGTLINATARSLAVVSVLLSIFGLWWSYRQASGTARQRIYWVALSMGAIYTTYMMFNLSEFFRTPWFDFLETAIQLFASIGLAYASLRHRVFDFGFAVNRALVYGVVSVALLIAFGVVEWLTEHLIHFEEREKNVLLDGAIALGVYLAFHRVRHAVEHAVERVFFHRWHVNEEGLRRFMKQAAYFTDADALLAASSQALRRFSSEADCVVYWRTEGSIYRRCAASAALPDAIEANHAIVVALRAEQAAVFNEDVHSELPIALAVPIMHRGGLEGFVLLGPKSNQASYRPDEVAVLGDAVHQIGLDLHTLHVERSLDDVRRWREESNKLRQENSVLRGQVEFAQQAGLLLSQRA